jgi:hypothetical protein
MVMRKRGDYGITCESAMNKPTASASIMNLPLPTRVGVIVIVGPLLMVARAGIATLQPAMSVGKGEEVNDAARVYAGYLV